MADKLIIAMFPPILHLNTIAVAYLSLVLDHLLSEMESRFSSHQKTALLGLSLIPSLMVTLSTEEYTTKSIQLADMYREDLPSPDCVQSELHCWRLKWQQLSDNGCISLPSTPSLSATSHSNVPKQ